jgi:hypothetical protein
MRFWSQLRLRRPQAFVPFISVPCTDGQVFQRGGISGLALDTPQAPSNWALDSQGRESKSKSQTTGSCNCFLPLDEL